MCYIEGVSLEVEKIVLIIILLIIFMKICKCKCKYCWFYFYDVLSFRFCLGLFYILGDLELDFN